MSRLSGGRSASTVMVVCTGSAPEPVPVQAINRAGANCLSVDAEAAVGLMRLNPFLTRAIVLAGDGASPRAMAVLKELKDTAPRVPIIFVDENPTDTSELVIRRAGVHFYTHFPVSAREIHSVLSVLTGGLLRSKTRLAASLA